MGSKNILLKQYGKTLLHGGPILPSIKSSHLSQQIADTGHHGDLPLQNPAYGVLKTHGGNNMAIFLSWMPMYKSAHVYPSIL